MRKYLLFEPSVRSYYCRLLLQPDTRGRSRFFGLGGSCELSWCSSLFLFMNKTKAVQPQAFEFLSSLLAPPSVGFLWTGKSYPFTWRQPFSTLGQPRSKHTVHLLPSFHSGLWKHHLWVPCILLTGISNCIWYLWADYFVTPVMLNAAISEGDMLSLCWAVSWSNTTLCWR